MRNANYVGDPEDFTLYCYHRGRLFDVLPLVLVLGECTKACNHLDPQQRIPVFNQINTSSKCNSFRCGILGRTCITVCNIPERAIYGFWIRFSSPHSTTLRKVASESNVFDIRNNVKNDTHTH